MWILIRSEIKLFRAQLTVIFTCFFHGYIIQSHNKATFWDWILLGQNFNHMLNFLLCILQISKEDISSYSSKNVVVLFGGSSIRPYSYFQVSTLPQRSAAALFYFTLSLY